MAKYTTQLKTIIEEINGLTSPATSKQLPALIEQARPQLFDFPYQITDVTHKPVLERKILQHYLFREIGFETVGLWHFKLAAKMSEIMPYFDQLYQSAKLEFDPITNFNYNETAIATSTSTSDSNADTSLTANQNTTANNETQSKANSSQTDVAKDVNAYSNTPQSSLTGVESLTYLTDARIIDTNNTTDTDQTGQTTATENSDTTQKSDTAYKNHLESDNKSSNTINRKGYQGVNPADLLAKYRETLLNIDLMVIDSLADLFMLLY